MSRICTGPAFDASSFFASKKCDNFCHWMIFKVFISVTLICMWYTHMHFCHDCGWRCRSGNAHLGSLILALVRCTTDLPCDSMAPNDINTIPNWGWDDKKSHPRSLGPFHSCCYRLDVDGLRCITPSTFANPYTDETLSIFFYETTVLYRNNTCGM